MRGSTRGLVRFQWLRTALVVLSVSSLGACASFDKDLVSDEPAATSAVARTQQTFKSGGRNVRIEMIKGEGSGELPAVVVLHGASGIGSGYLIYPYAAAVAEHGMHAFVLHYYDGLPPRSGSPSSVGLHEARDQVIRDAISWISARRDVDANRIALMGVSLGGFHAVGLGARDERVAAVVNMMGAMPGSVGLDNIDRMPPTLILHGGRDRVVPLARAFSLASALDRIGASYEMKVYKAAGHNFNGATHSDSIRLAADFLDRKLNGRENVAMLSQ